MKFLRVGPAGAERPVLQSDGRYYDLVSVTPDIDGRFLARVADEGLQTRGLPEVDISGQRVGAPIARPGAIVCIGLNYADHAAESGVDSPRYPVVFYKAMGPWLATPHEVAPGAAGLRLRSWVNGEPRQDSSTDDMIFDVATLIHQLSQHMVLDPGDVINTGTPQGVALSGWFAYLRPGDVVEMEIEGLGRQRSRVVGA